MDFHLPYAMLSQPGLKQLPEESCYETSTNSLAGIISSDETESQQQFWPVETPKKLI